MNLQRYGWKPKHDTRLLTYLNGNMGELAALLKQMNVIDDVPDPLPQLHPERMLPLPTLAIVQRSC